MTPASAPPASVLSEISNAMVALHRKHFGRGAGAAKSYVLDGMAVCILRDVFTPVEKTLMEAGKFEHVRRARLLHQVALEAEYTEPVEALTGRKVEAFVSSIHVDPDVVVQTFLLEPGS
jgi:uncharacterized protein YbcI